MDQKKRTYHINPDTGRPNICRATKRGCAFKISPEEHYDSDVEARKAYEQRMSKEKIPVSITKKKKRSSISTSHTKIESSDSIKEYNNKIAVKDQKLEEVDQEINQLKEQLHLLRRDEINSKADRVMKEIAQQGSFKAKLAKDTKLEFYHEGTPPDYVRSYGEKPLSNTEKIDENLRGKPYNVLWLSTGHSNKDGAISSWRLWSVQNDFGNIGKELHKAKFNENSVILEINESNRQDVKKLLGLDGNDLPPRNPYLGDLGSRYMGNFMGGDSIDWGKLKDFGIDSVRINGETERETFYGYDVDSLIILNGDMIEGWESEPAMEPKVAMHYDTFFNDEL